MEYKKHKYKKVEVEDERLEKGMDRSIKGLSTKKNLVSKRRGCY